MIVFRNGILTFHSSPTPHPANVRRRIRQLKDYIQVSADWICYALIDDIVDGFAPLLEGVEQEVDTIDEGVLRLHREEEDETGEMLQRIGGVRKKVMGLLRLLGSKADVIKGFSKRCNEKWEVAPRSEIGLYLGDIQGPTLPPFIPGADVEDHIVTMVQNLNHYEKILSRSHSNYLAQISIEMAKANNDTNETLSRLTVLGTILIPMNLITGLWVSPLQPTYHRA
jgi:magnesium transporter